VGRRTGTDPRTGGSGNPGATNVTRLAGWRAGAVVLAGDAGKGALAALLGLSVARGVDLPEAPLAVAAGAAAVVGHVFPLWPRSRRLRGGKGVATWLGAVAVALPGVAAVALAAWALVALGTRRASVASVVAVLAVPVVAALTGWGPPTVLITASVAALVVVTHRSNLVRLVAGTEDAVRL
jgi:glycerol-3-phosphate acyltransferase PlsY